ncbi:sodium/glutamate symporter [Brevibacillus ruminantium]|uniref:Sodium/glutamate symporter n=1 Tax=Brevibacillus ruminantium TaxID=2950604 RepID=A0ABY4WL32_9BACL|nr:sodium/glutamate symporter [Brevibacillus ruminantium]USG67873.1 sodium/glutamate symporter [Brevibacillus ruminantium]
MIINEGVLELNLITSTAVGIFLLLLGMWLNKKVDIFKKYCIPSPVIGGFSFAVIVWLLREFDVVQLKTDTTIGDLLMFVFFVTIGLAGSLSLIKKGGKVLFFYILVCWGLAIFQNGFGVALASLLGIDPLLGIASGSAALEGGHGMAAAMAPSIEAAGGTGALTVGLAAATYGLVAGSLIGGPLGNWLIKKNKLKIETDDNWARSVDEPEKQNQVASINYKNVLTIVAVILLVLAFGTNVAKWLTYVTGFTIPGHVFSLFVGLLFASFNNKKNIVHIDSKILDVFSMVALELFLTMAMMNLKIWELYDLAVPLLIILLAQTIAIIFIAWLIIFKVTGKNYDAALLAAGFIGHGLGATANALAVMDAITKKYGVVSKKAFFIIPVSGSMLVDIVGVPSIVIFTNFFAH